MQQPAEDEVRRELERIVASSRFASAERNSRFLRFVVDKQLAGQGGEIKEIVIATEVYGRSSGYDPKVDSVVRVEASRLRAKLKAYYEQEGAGNPVRIRIPAGCYVPEFTRAAAAPMNAGRPERSGAGRRRWLALPACGLAAVLLLAKAGRPHEDQPHPEALGAWQEGNELLRLDPHSAVVERGMPPSLERAISRYEFAVAKDPSFARGWASLAEAYDYASAYAGRDWHDDTRRAEAAARRAIELNDRLAAGHAMLGLVRFGMRFDFAGAERAYRRAIELDPRSIYAVVEYADLLRATGRLEEAEAQVRKARARRPAVPVLAVKEAELQLDRRQPDAAIAILTETLRLAHDNRRAHVYLGTAWEAKGDFARAFGCYQTALGMNPQDRRALPALGYLLGVTGRRAEAQAIAARLEAFTARVRNVSYQVAIVYAGLGDHARALDWLERALETRQAAIPMLAVERRFDALRGHPRFRAIQDKLGIANR
jgi:tetratricopeptide (TPR) repeat protein